MRLLLLLLVGSLSAFVHSRGEVSAEAGPKLFDEHPENRWVKQSPRPGAPAPRFSWEGSGSYDLHQRLWIHWGGHDGIPQGFALFTFDLQTGKWTQRFPPTSPAGVCCVDGASVFDVAIRRFVRFPGASLGHGYQWSRGVKLKSSAVWLYDTAANAWMNMRPPPYAAATGRDGLGTMNAAATYDPARELAISFGGQGNAGGMNNLFVYDAHANRLERLAAANPPSPRDGMGLAYDPGNDCLVMFGSQYASDEKTWIYRFETNRWEGHDLEPHPPGKKLGTYSTIPKMAYDARNNICLCIAWDTNSNKHETWALDVATKRWTKMNPAEEPAPSMSRSRNLAYSPEHNLFILETSNKEGRGKEPEIWTYRYRKTAELRLPAAPADLKVVTEAKSATLTWTSAAGAKEYHIYRAKGSEPWRMEFTRVAASREARWQDADLSPGDVSFYYVKAIGLDGTASPASQRARTQPRVELQPVVSVLAKDRVQVQWKAHTAADVVGYNVYRGVVSVRTVKKGTPAAWKDNDPEYAEPVVVEVRNITDIKKLNTKLLTETQFSDAGLDLSNPGVESADYRFAVYAYIVRAVNRLGTESGPSPYALTIPSEPVNVFNREEGEVAHLKWDASPEQATTGYHVYKLEGTWNIVRITNDPIRETAFFHKGGKGTTRYWVTALDALGQEGQPSSPVWHNQKYAGFYVGEWHQ
jgi:hypothetical protein